MASPPPISYTNLRGVTFYLHAGTTKTGKPRYFVAKTVGPGALTAVPAGFELTESINGVVAVRRIDQHARSFAADLDLVRAELARHAHLRRHRASVAKAALVIFEPINGGLPNALASGALAARFGFPSGLATRVVPSATGTRYTPVLKLVPTPHGYALHRMTYRGDGGWSWPLASGPLAQLARRYIPLIGTDAFFDLH